MAPARGGGPPQRKRNSSLSVLRYAVIIVTIAWALLLLYVVQGQIAKSPKEEPAAVVYQSAPPEKQEQPLIPPVELTARLDQHEEEEQHHPLKPAVVEDRAAQSSSIISSSSSSGEMVMELDEQTGLQVPEWWVPAAGVDVLDEEQRIDGEPTIFLMIASYRDFQCRDTIISALQRATRPSRVVVAAVEQNGPDDVPCTEPEKPCEEAPDQLLCVHKERVHVYKMDAREATGPVYARHVGYRMYRGEAYAMQIDAHCIFANRWDDDIIAQFKATGNEMAVLSTYLTDLTGSLSPEGDSLRNTRPIMCNSDYEGAGKARYLRHGSQPEAMPPIKTSPMLQPYWAAGFSFARGHFIHKVRYDCCLPMVFMGEEISIGIRGWTHGYDMYAPTTSVLFHEYAQSSAKRRKVPKFWEAGGKARGEGQRSLKRLTALIGMSNDIDPSEWSHTREGEYGLGTERDVAQFYKLVLADVVNREAQPLCKFVEPGGMHREIHDKHLRANGRGIDYSKVDVDVQSFIDEKLYTPAANKLRRALNNKDAAVIKRALAEARRMHLGGRENFATVVDEAQAFLDHQQELGGKR